MTFAFQIIGTKATAGDELNLRLMAHSGNEHDRFIAMLLAMISDAPDDMAFSIYASGAFDYSGQARNMAQLNLKFVALGPRSQPPVPVSETSQTSKGESNDMNQFLKALSIFHIITGIATSFTQSAGRPPLAQEAATLAGQAIDTATQSGFLPTNFKDELGTLIEDIAALHPAVKN